MLFMIRNFTSDEVSGKILNHSIFDLNIGTDQDKMITKKVTDSLRDVLKTLNEFKFAVIPIVDADETLIGTINKSHLTIILEEMTFDYLDKPVSEFLGYLKNEYRVDPLEDVIYIGKDDS